MIELTFKSIGTRYSKWSITEKDNATIIANSGSLSLNSKFNLDETKAYTFKAETKSDVGVGWDGEKLDVFQTTQAYLLCSEDETNIPFPYSLETSTESFNFKFISYPSYIYSTINENILKFVDVSKGSNIVLYNGSESYTSSNAMQINLNITETIVIPNNIQYVEIIGDESSDVSITIENNENGINNTLLRIDGSKINFLNIDFKEYNYVPEFINVSNCTNIIKAYFADGQIGSDIKDITVGQLGFSVSLSNNGSKVAIGAPKNNSNKGVVQIYEGNISTNTWDQVGADIIGTEADSESGTSVSLSSNGKRVAIGAPKSDSNGRNSGQVKIYELNETSGDWNEIAQMQGISNDHFGSSVSLSSDGTIIAIGGPNHGEDILIYSGQVKIYELNETSSDWDLMGETFKGETINEKLGTSVSLSSNGKRVAIGAPKHQRDEITIGNVKIYEFNEISKVWNQMGQPIYGEANNEEFGTSVSLSGDGTMIAVGAPKSDTNSGYVRVFKYYSTWIQLGNSIDGNSGDKFGNALSLSKDGHRLTIGAPENSDTTDRAGYASVYDFNGADWVQITDIYGTIGEKFGSSVSLSGDGTKVSVGGPFRNVYGTDGSLSQYASGYVSVYALPDLPVSEPIPNPNPGFPNFIEQKCIEFFHRTFAFLRDYFVDSYPDGVAPFKLTDGTISNPVNAEGHYTTKLSINARLQLLRLHKPKDVYIVIETDKATDDILLILGQNAIQPYKVANKHYFSIPNYSSKDVDDVVPILYAHLGITLLAVTYYTKVFNVDLPTTISVKNPKLQSYDTGYDVNPFETTGSEKKYSMGAYVPYLLRNTDDSQVDKIKLTNIPSGYYVDVMLRTNNYQRISPTEVDVIHGDYTITEVIIVIVKSLNETKEHLLDNTNVTFKKLTRTAPDTVTETLYTTNEYLRFLVNDVSYYTIGGFMLNTQVSSFISTYDESGFFNGQVDMEQQFDFNVENMNDVTFVIDQKLPPYMLCCMDGNMQVDNRESFTTGDEISNNGFNLSESGRMTLKAKPIVGVEAIKGNTIYNSSYNGYTFALRKKNDSGENFTSILNYIKPDKVDEFKLHNNLTDDDIELLNTIIFGGTHNGVNYPPYPSFNNYIQYDGIESFRFDLKGKNIKDVFYEILRDTASSRKVTTKLQTEYGKVGEGKLRHYTGGLADSHEMFYDYLDDELFYMYFYTPAGGVANGFIYKFNNVNSQFFYEFPKDLAKVSGQIYILNKTDRENSFGYDPTWSMSGWKQIASMYPEFDSSSGSVTAYGDTSGQGDYSDVKVLYITEKIKDLNSSLGLKPQDLYEFVVTENTNDESVVKTGKLKIKVPMNDYDESTIFVFGTKIVDAYQLIKPNTKYGNTMNKQLSFKKKWFKDGFYDLKSINLPTNQGSPTFFVNLNFATSMSNPANRPSAHIIVANSLSSVDKPMFIGEAIEDDITLPMIQYDDLDMSTSFNDKRFEFDIAAGTFLIKSIYSYEDGTRILDAYDFEEYVGFYNFVADESIIKSKLLFSEELDSAGNKIIIPKDSITMQNIKSESKKDDTEIANIKGLNTFVYEDNGSFNVANVTISLLYNGITKSHSYNIEKLVDIFKKSALWESKNVPLNEYVGYYLSDVNSSGNIVISEEDGNYEFHNAFPKIRTRRATNIEIIKGMKVPWYGNIDDGFKPVFSLDQINILNSVRLGEENVKKFFKNDNITGILFGANNMTFSASMWSLSDQHNSISNIIDSALGHATYENKKVTLKKPLFTNLNLRNMQTHNSMNQSINANGGTIYVASNIEILKITGELNDGSMIFINFENKDSIKQVDCSELKYKNVIPQSAFRNMFKDCVNLRSAIFALDNSVIESKAFESMFDGCINLTNADFKFLLGTTINASAFKNMFNSCDKLENVDFSSLDGATANWTNQIENGFVNTFNSCASLQNLYINTDGNLLRNTNAFSNIVRRQDLNRVIYTTKDNWDFSLRKPVMNPVATFTLARELTMEIFDSVLHLSLKNAVIVPLIFYESIETSSVTFSITNNDSIYNERYNAMSIDFDSITIEKNVVVPSTIKYLKIVGTATNKFSLNISKVSDNNNTLLRVDASELNFDGNIPSKAFWEMFKNCKKLKSVNLSGLVGNQISDWAFYEMFEGCSELSDVNLSNLTGDDSIGTDVFGGMFKSCHKLENLYINLDGNTFKTTGITAFDGIAQQADLTRVLHTDKQNWEWAVLSGSETHAPPKVFNVLQTTYEQITTTPSPTPSPTPADETNTGTTATPSPTPSPTPTTYNITTTPSPTPTPSSSGAIVGDPYISCLDGSLYKIANRNAYYRLYKDDNLMINVKIERFNENDVNRNTQLFALSNGYNWNFNETNMYYMSEVYIKSKLGADVYNFKTGMFNKGIYKEHEGDDVLKHCDIYKGSKIMLKSILIDDKEVRLCLSSNPQIISGLEMTIWGVLPNKMNGLIIGKQGSKGQILKSLTSEKNTKFEYKEGKKIDETFFNEDLTKTYVKSICVL